MRVTMVCNCGRRGNIHCHACGSEMVSKGYGKFAGSYTCKKCGDRFMVDSPCTAPPPPPPPVEIILQAIPNAVCEKCGRPAKPHCPACGAGNVHTVRKHARIETTSTAQFIVMSYACGRCGHRFYADSVCAAPPPYARAGRDKSVDELIEKQPRKEREKRMARAQRMLAGLIAKRTGESEEQPDVRDQVNGFLTQHEQAAPTQNDEKTGGLSGGMRDDEDDWLTKR